MSLLRIKVTVKTIKLTTAKRRRYYPASFDHTRDFFETPPGTRSSRVDRLVRLSKFAPDNVADTIPVMYI